VKFISQIIPEIILIEPIVHEDHRGYFQKHLEKNFLRKKLDIVEILFKRMNQNLQKVS